MEPSFERRLAPGVDPSTVQSDPELVALIAAEIDRDGPMTFARFMELALYEPIHGYYTAEAARPTREGDFLTAPELDPVVGRLVGRQLAEVWERLGRPDRFVVREHGAGAGTLGLSILEGLTIDQPALAERLVYQPVEVNPHRLRDLEQRFAAAGLADRLAPADGPVIGAIVANELLDALPVHRVRGIAGGIEELFVVRDGASFGWQAGPPSTAALAARLAAVGVTLADGQTAEIRLATDGWVRDATAALDRGIVLIVDYGAPASEVYGPTRPEGTLRAYLGHRVHADPFRHIGRQDLTAHVDTTAVASAARAAGLDVLGETSQAAFVAALGIGDLLVEAGAHAMDPDGTALARYVALRSSVGRLLDPRALGGFRVQILGRGVPDEPPLRGLTPLAAART